MWDEDRVALFLDSFYGDGHAGSGSGGGWDPFGLRRVAADKEAVAHRARAGRRSRQGRGRGETDRGSKSGRLLDQDEPDGALTLHSAPGGLSPGTFILLCAVTPVAIYALCITAAARLGVGTHSRGVKGKGSKAAGTTKAGLLPMVRMYISFVPPLVLPATHF